MDTTIRAPLIRRTNPRMVVFIGTFLLLIGWPIYTYLAETLTHSFERGIIDLGNYNEIDLKAMGSLRFNPRNATLESIPAHYRALDGQKVKLNGLVMLPLEARSGLSEFTIIHSVKSCCYLTLPQVQERVNATSVPGRMLQYFGDVRYDIFGTLHLTMKRDQAGDVIEVYHLDAESMNPAL